MIKPLYVESPLPAEDYLDVVDSALAPLSRRLPASVSRDDLAGAGRLALVKALHSFVGPTDEARAYCFARVRGAMLDELRRLDPLSRRARARVTLVRKASDAIAQRLGRAATAGEVAEATELPIAVVRRTEQLALAAQTYEPAIGDDVFSRVPDEDTVSPVERAESSELATVIGEALERLPEKQAYVLRRYYVEDATLEVIAGEIGVSKERIRQIRNAGEAKLRRDYAVLALWQSFVNSGA
jgi:RNA polymerase sigma factor for flagellar operon FliA